MTAETSQTLDRGLRVLKLLADTDHKVTNVTSLDNAALAQALQAKGITATPAGTGLRVDAAPVEVGRTAAEGSIVLTDLRSADGGLEDLFLENGGFDKETDRTSIILNLSLRFFGRSIAGEAVDTTPVRFTVEFVP